MDGIELVERDGDVPTGDTVKKVMCAQMGVAGGINAQSLDKEVERLLDERDRTRRERRIAALPNASAEAAKKIGGVVEAAVLDHLSIEHENLRNVASRKLANLNADLTTQREQIRALLARIDAKDEEIAELEEKNLSLNGRLELAASEIINLKETISAIGREDDIRTQMLALMKDALAMSSQQTKV
ncbi:hypothetical protein [Pseudooceanicola nanhaiensis]|uniref:hypothetical protein n=1 Tax=Pseudooceanicola nanhaiensis TaxID=375761 RepID=UPI003515FD7F